MMLKKLLLTLTLFLGSIGLAVSATKGDTYAGGQYAMLTYNETDFGDYKPTMALGRYGMYMGENFAIEGRAGLGIGDDSKRVTYLGYDVDTKVEVDNLLGVYAVGVLPAGDMLDVYGFAGMSRITLTATASLVGGTPSSSSDSETSLSLGAGANIKLGKSTAINIEYASYYDKDNITIKALAIGVIFNL